MTRLPQPSRLTHEVQSRSQEPPGSPHFERWENGLSSTFKRIPTSETLHKGRSESIQKRTPVKMSTELCFSPSVQMSTWAFLSPSSPRPSIRLSPLSQGCSPLLCSTPLEGAAGTALLSPLRVASRPAARGPGFSSAHCARFCPRWSPRFWSSRAPTPLGAVSRAVLFLILSSLFSW